MKIDIILTDNGFEFTNKHIKSKKGECCKKEAKFTEKCIEKSIEYRTTLPYHPQTNGMVERVNFAIKTATIKAHSYLSITERQKELDNYLAYYNLERRHGALQKETKCRTPYEALEMFYRTRPDLFKENPVLFTEKLLSFCNKIMGQRI